jgi:hypothetical protein
LPTDRDEQKDPVLKMTTSFLNSAIPCTLLTVFFACAASTALVASPPAAPAPAASPTLANLPVNSYNPILKADARGTMLFTADPAVFVEGDTLYVYAGRDEARLGGWYTMNQWVCFSTKDMITWKYEGVPIKCSDFAWASPGTAWASHVVKKNGKYYFYSTSGRPNRQGYAIGVAVSDKPTGPFVDAKKEPLFDNALTTGNKQDSMEDLDPTVLLDDDGQAYIYWGNGKLHYALLSEDMLSLKDLNGDGKITEGADVFTDVPIKNNPGGFGEAAWLHKHNGKYYLTHASGLPQKIVYAMSDSPRGPWQHKGVILDQNLCPDGGKGNVNSDTSHPAIIEFKGQSYLFYHNAAQPSGGQTRRSVCVEKLQYNPDGTIQRTFISSTGLTGIASRLQSFRQKDQFVRFVKYDVKIEAPNADARPFQWELLRGLNDPAAADLVSIQSVSHPGYYLTINGANVELAKHDNTPAFKQKATFKMVPGLADKSWVSFESPSDPTVYLRQSDADGKLKAEKITPASTAADKEDATFKF